MATWYPAVALGGLPAAVLRDAVAAAALAHDHRPGVPRPGLPAADSVGVARRHGHWRVWAGDGTAVVVMNRPAAPGPDLLVALDGAALRLLELPAVLRGFRARCMGAAVHSSAAGWEHLIQRRRRAPPDPSGVLLGLLITSHRRCSAPDHAVAVALAGATPWFIPVIPPDHASPRCAAMTKRRAVVVATPT